MYTIEIEILIVFIVIAVAAVISGISVVYNHIEGLRNDMKAFKQKMAAKLRNIRNNDLSN